MDEKSIEEKIIAEWKSDPKLRQEFENDLNSWAAFRRNELAGNIKVLGKKS